MNSTESATNIITSSLSGWMYTGIAVYMTVVGIINVVGNTAAIITVRKLQLTCKVFIINISVADIIQGTIGYPMAAYSSYMETWKFEPAECTLYGYVCFSSSVVTILTHCVVAFHRFYHVCHHNSGSIFQRRTSSYIIVVITWLISIICCSLPLLGFGSYTFESFGTTCSLDWREGNKTNMAYIIFTFVLVLIIPEATTIIMYSRVAKYTRSTINVRPVDASSTNHPIENTLKKEINNRVLKVLCGSMVAFVSVWLPYGIIFIIRSAGFGIPVGVVALLTMLAKQQCALNPLIYVFSSSHWYKKIKTLAQVQARTHSANYELS